MSAESPALVRAFKVGHRTVTITLRKPVFGMVLHSVIEWAPDVPRGLNTRELRQYRDGRNTVFAEFASLTGMRTMVVEV